MTNKIAVWMGVAFCSFVVVLLVILYYPKDSVEQEFDVPEAFTQLNFDTGFHGDIPEEESSKNSLTDFARSLEDCGAAILAVVAVGCIVAGLACLACACCCLMG